MVTIGERIRALRTSKHWSQYKLALLSEVKRSTIDRIENRKTREPRQENLRKIAKAFNITYEQFVAGTDLETGTEQPKEESYEELLDRARMAAPLRIPVYSEFHAGEEHVEPSEYFYLPRTMAAGGNIEAYIVHGHCLSPKVENGDVVIVDRNLSPESGDILLCLADRELVCGRYEQKNGEAYIHNSSEKINLDECRVTAVIIQVIKRLR